MNVWDYTYKYNYETDFSFLNTGSKFPTERQRCKNAEYAFRKKEYSGKYGDGRYLVAMVNKCEKAIPYKVISLNYFKLLTSKICDLIFNNEITIKADTADNTAKLNNLVDRLNWVSKIRKAVKYVTIYGDSCIKTYKNGLSVFTPNKAFKIVEDGNVDNVIAYVLCQPITKNKAGTVVIEYIRFEVHFEGKVFEIVKKYVGGVTAGTLGEAVDYVYNNRKISKEGNWYDTGISDCSMVQWLTINQEVDGVYGESVYQDIQDIVFALEHRISMEHHALNSLADPLLIVGMSSVITDEQGNYKLKTINGNMLVTEDRDNTSAILPQQFQQEFKLDSYEQFIDTLKSELYELSELGRIYLSSEYSGNISEESISNLIKGAIDKACRILNDVYDSIRDSLYVLAVTNNIEVNKEDLTVIFNIGQTDNDKNIAEVCKILIDAGVLSRNTLRSKYFGYTLEQSIEEQRQIDIESKQNIEIEDQNDILQNEDLENSDIQFKEG